MLLVAPVESKTYVLHEYCSCTGKNTKHASSARGSQFILLVLRLHVHTHLHHTATESPYQEQHHLSRTPSRQGITAIENCVRYVPRTKAEVILAVRSDFVFCCFALGLPSLSLCVCAVG